MPGVTDGEAYGTSRRLHPATRQLKHDGRQGGSHACLAVRFFRAVGAGEPPIRQELTTTCVLKSTLNGHGKRHRHGHEAARPSVRHDGTTRSATRENKSATTRNKSPDSFDKSPDRISPSDYGNRRHGWGCPFRPDCIPLSRHKSPDERPCTCPSPHDPVPQVEPEALCHILQHRAAHHDWPDMQEHCRCRPFHDAPREGRRPPTLGEGCLGRLPYGHCPARFSAILIRSSPCRTRHVRRRHDACRQPGGRPAYPVRSRGKTVRTQPLRIRHSRSPTHRTE